MLCEDTPLYASLSSLKLILHMLTTIRGKGGRQPKEVNTVPLFDYYCPVCKKSTERITGLSATVMCCDTVCERQVAKPVVRPNGRTPDDFFKDIKRRPPSESPS
jgi:ribosomal protein L37AE/L43A